MPQYVVIEKQVGETPLSAIEKYREKRGWEKDIPLAFAGRLDPLAHGALLVLVGDECKKQNKYLKLDKEYEFEVLLGFRSDTGDVLGLATYDSGVDDIHDEELHKVAKRFVGKLSLPYPAFSSKPVKGKPLFMWALENRLSEIEIPVKNSEIYRLSYEGSRMIEKKGLHKKILEKINSIPPVQDPHKERGKDFRRVEIRARWEEIFKEQRDTHEFQIARFRCICSSGTYMRTLAGEIGRALGTAGLAFSIHRPHIGKYQKIWREWGFWLKKYS